MYVEVGCVFYLLFECCYPWFFLRIVIYNFICVVNCYYIDACLFSLDPLQCFTLMCFGETIIIIGWCTAHAQLFNFRLFMFCCFYFYFLFFLYYYYNDGSKINVVCEWIIFVIDLFTHHKLWFTRYEKIWR